MLPDAAVVDVATDSPPESAAAVLLEKKSLTAEAGRKIVGLKRSRGAAAQAAGEAAVPVAGPIEKAPKKAAKKAPASRIDFVLRHADDTLTFIEVKSVTLTAPCTPLPPLWHPAGSLQVFLSARTREMTICATWHRLHLSNIALDPDIDVHAWTVTCMEVGAQLMPRRQATRQHVNAK